MPPPVKCGKRFSSPMKESGIANVASARYGPAKRVAISPNASPSAPATTPASGIVQRSRQPWSTTRIVVVYAPMPMKAPWPSEIWPVKPVRMFSPSSAIR